MLRRLLWDSCVLFVVVRADPDIELFCPSFFLIATRYLWTVHGTFSRISLRIHNNLNRRLHPLSSRTRPLYQAGWPLISDCLRQAIT